MQIVPRLDYGPAMTALNFPDRALLDKLAALLGPQGFVTDPDLTTPWLADWRR